MMGIKGRRKEAAKIKSNGQRSHLKSQRPRSIAGQMTYEGTPPGVALLVQKRIEEFFSMPISSCLESFLQKIRPRDKKQRKRFEEYLQSAIAVAADLEKNNVDLHFFFDPYIWEHLGSAFRLLLWQLLLESLIAPNLVEGSIPHLNGQMFRTGTNIPELMQRAFGQDKESPELADIVTTLFSDLTKARMNTRRRGGSEPVVKASPKQCMEAAREYPAILKHWQKTKKVLDKDPQGNWRDHAKVDYPDTPDDLLDLLAKEEPYQSEPFRLALSHALRRASIETQGCSIDTLKRLIRKGNALLGNQ